MLYPAVHSLLFGRAQKNSEEWKFLQWTRWLAWKVSLSVIEESVQLSDGDGNHKATRDGVEVDEDRD